MTAPYCPPYLFEHISGDKYGIWKQTVVGDANLIYQKISHTDCEAGHRFFTPITAGRQNVVEMRNTYLERRREWEKQGWWFYRLKGIEDIPEKRVLLINPTEMSWFNRMLPEAEKISEGGRKWKERLDAEVAKWEAEQLAAKEKEKKEMEEKLVKAKKAEAISAERRADNLLLNDEFRKVIVSLDDSPTKQILTALLEKGPFQLFDAEERQRLAWTLKYPNSKHVWTYDKIWRAYEVPEEYFNEHRSDYTDEPGLHLTDDFPKGIAIYALKEALEERRHEMIQWKKQVEELKAQNASGWA